MIKEMDESAKLRGEGENAGIVHRRRHRLLRLDDGEADLEVYAFAPCARWSRCGGKSIESC